MRRTNEFGVPREPMSGFSFEATHSSHPLRRPVSRTRWQYNGFVPDQKDAQNSGHVMSRDDQLTLAFKCLFVGIGALKDSMNKR